MDRKPSHQSINLNEISISNEKSKTAQNSSPVSRENSQQNLSFRYQPICDESFSSKPYTSRSFPSKFETNSRIFPKHKRKRQDSTILIQSSTIEEEKSLLEGYLQVRFRRNIEVVDHYYDRCPLLDLRKGTLRVVYAISEACLHIVKNRFFEGLVILVILMNTIVLALEDPSLMLSTGLNDIETFFLYFYTAECCLKVLAKGFVLSKGSYLRDKWNLLDFTVVLSAWVTKIGGSGVKLSALRTLRILRPLRSISSVKGIRSLFLALFDSIKPLISALVVLFFFILIFAIAGLQLWSGTLSSQCLHIDTGVYYDSTPCGLDNCVTNYVCVNSLDNPNYGTTSFDNIFISFVMVFQILTLEGWTQIMEWNQRAFSYFSILYYIPLVFIGANLIMNLTLAIITSSFTAAVHANTLPEPIPNKLDFLNENLPTSAIVKQELSECEAITKNISDANNELLHNGASKSFTRLKFNSIKNIANSRIVPPLKFEIDRSWSENGDGSYVENKHELFVPSPRLNELSERKLGNHGKKQNFIATRDDSVKFKTKEWENLPDETNIEHFTKNYTLIKRIRSALTIKPDQSAVYSNKVDQYFGMDISEHFKIISTSKLDVVPKERKNLRCQAESFRYKLKKNLNPLKKLQEKYENFSYSFIKKHLFRFNKPHAAFASMCGTVSSIILQTQQADSLNKSIIGEWSGKEISRNEADYGTYQLNFMTYTLWSTNWTSTWEKICFIILSVISHKYTINLVTFAVIFNTAVLSVDHYGISNEDSQMLANMNGFFTYFFAGELVLRLVGMGFSKFLRDRMNYFDSIVVFLSLIEISILSGGTSALSAFRAIRVFRIFRVLRVVRLLRYMNSMIHIVKAIGKSLSNFGYLFLLLGLFLVIFTLLGMTIYSGQFNFPEGLPRGNFDTFHWGFVTTFQVLTTENWNDILTSSLRSSAGPVSSLFLITWVVLGNFIFLNLFLAILIESFSGEEETQDEFNHPELRLISTSNMKIKKKLQLIEDMKVESESENYTEELEQPELMKSISKLFKGNYCQKSYFIFEKNNKVRVFCFKIISNPFFDNLTLFVIILNSVKLVWDTYLLDSPSSSPQKTVSNVMDYVFTGIFMLEFLLKSIGMGFFIDEGTYLKDRWNILDLLIIGFSIIDYSVSSVDISIIKLFRLLRALRPLRLISHNLSMKIVVIALIESIRAILNVLIVIVIIWLVFAILGVSLLAGKMHSCEDTNILTQLQCENSGFNWVNTNANFDNIIEAMITLFIVMSQESWPNRMFEGVDATDVGTSPVRNYNPPMAYFYIIYFMVGNFFLVNLFTAVVFDKFTEARKNESSIAMLILNKEQRNWMEIRGMILNSKPVVEASHAPKNPVRAFFFYLAKSKYFEITMMGAILTNMIVMALPYQGASAEYLLAVDDINMGLTIVFILEACVKLLGQGLTLYFKNNWNKFDFFVVSTSSIDLIIEFAVGSNFPLLRSVPQLIRVIRVLRIARLLRLVKSLKSLQDLIMIIAYVLPAILNILSLLLLIFFIFAVLGSFLFHSVKQGKYIIGEYYNFHNFGYSMVILWRISTGEDYPSVMYDCAHALDSQVYYVYFIVFVTLIDFVILELFVSVIIQNYEEQMKNSDSALQIFNKDIKKFRRVWSKFAFATHGVRVNREELVGFINEFGPMYGLLPSNFNSEYSKHEVFRLISGFNIKNISGNYYYNDVLYAVMRRKYGKKIYFIQAKLSTKLMRKEENKAKKSLDKIRQKALSDLNEGLPAKTEDDIFFKMMNIKNIFTKWKAYSKRIKRRSVLSITPRFSDLEHPGDVSLQSFVSLSRDFL